MMKNTEYPKVGDVVAQEFTGWITEITRVAIDRSALGRRLVAFSVRGRDRDGIPTRINIDYPARDWFDGNFAPVQVQSAPDTYHSTVDSSAPPQNPEPAADGDSSAPPQNPEPAADGETRGLDGAQPLQGFATTYDLGLAIHELEAFEREATAHGLTIATWLRGLGRKAVGLDP